MGLIMLWGVGGAWAQLDGVLALSNGERIPLSELPPSPPGAKALEIYSGMEFSINYTDPAGVGFNAAAPDGPMRQATLSLALEYIAGVLNQPGGRVDIDVNSVSVSGGTLAYAGPLVFWWLPVTGGINNGAVFNHIANPATDPSPTQPDMELTVNWNHNYNLGTAAPAGNQYDLLTVLIHEITHGLGYLSALVYNDTLCGGGSKAQGSGWTGSQPDLYTVFDTLLQTGNDHRFVNASFLYTGQASYFLGGDAGVFVTGAQASAALGSLPPIYAPASYQCGSSMSHWNYQGGVMDPSVSAGVMRREYAPFEVAFLRDIGYVNAGPAATEGEGSAEGEGQVDPCSGILPFCPEFHAEGVALYAQGTTLLGQALDWNTSDLDGSGIPDSWEVALFERVVCTAAVAWREDAVCVFEQNLATLRAEGNYGLVDVYENTVAAMLSVSSELQGALAPLGLTGVYAQVGTAAKLPGELLAADGNADGDPFTNRMEYDNTIAASLGKNDFVTAALNPVLDGSQAASEALPVGGPLLLSALVCLLAGAGPLALLRRRAR
jgi:hypothetical protein